MSDEMFISEPFSNFEGGACFKGVSGDGFDSHFTFANESWHLTERILDGSYEQRYNFDIRGNLIDIE